MTDRIKRQLLFLEERKHKAYRRELSNDEKIEISNKIQDEALSDIRRVTLRLKLFLEKENIVLLEDTYIQGLRTIISFPDIFSEEQMKKKQEQYFLHEKGKITNISCDYGIILSEGLESRRLRALKALKKEGTDKEFIACACKTIDIIEAFSDRYSDALENVGKITEGKMLRGAIRNGATCLAQALQIFRILHFALWAAGNYHNTVGRFDQYIYKFYENDIRNNISRDILFELIEDFMLSFNRDSDLYFGIQWGDNLCFPIF